MPGLFLDEIADFCVNADKMAPSPSSLFMPSVVVGGGLHSSYSNNNNAQNFDHQVQQQPLCSAQDLAAELAVKLGFNNGGGAAAASLAAAFQQQQQQQTSFLAAYRNVTGGDGLNSGGESRSSCSETDYAALNEPTAFELLHIAAAAAAQRKSQNTTECVPVPSSEHVAEIVGRQGCKIKALRAKTNTYIKTPVRGEDSIFVVTGRKEDVAAAKQEIVSAAEHFTQIRASRRHSQGGIPAPGHITAYVRVPYKFVGLVVGPKGATIKRIQQQTHTYIVTPSRDKEPVFEVTGLSENVESARREIETHIGSRTGQIFQPAAFLDTNYNGMVVPNADFDLNNHHHFNQLSPSNSVHSAVASILKDFHMNGTDSLSSCGVVGVCSSNADSSIISSSYGSQTSGSSSSTSSSSSSSNSGQIQHQFSGVVGQIICKPTNNGVVSAAALPTYQQQLQCSNNEDSLSTNGFISSQVQIGYNAWTNSTVNLNPRTVSSNNSDINGYLLLNGAKNLHSLSSIPKSGNSSETDDNGWFRSGFVNNSASFLNREFLTPDFCNENQPRQQTPSSGVKSSAPPPPCALLPSFLSSIWSNNDNVDDDLLHSNNHHVGKFRSSSLGDSQMSTATSQNCQAGTSVGLKLVA